MKKKLLLTLLAISLPLPAYASSDLYVSSTGNVGIANTSPNALLDIGLAGTTTGTMRLEGGSSGYIQIQPAAAAGSWTMTLPSGAGSSGQVLVTDGTGNTSWGTAGGSASTVINSDGRLLCGGSAPPCHSTSLSYCPYKGNLKTTAAYGVYTIPSGTASSGCLTATLTDMYVGGISGQSAAANTLYYVYLISVSGTTYLDLETTGHATDSTTGIEIMSGNNTKTLVGMIHTDGSKEVATDGDTTVSGDTNTVATWDNPTPTGTACQFTALRATTGTAGWQEINSENRCYFMSWGNSAAFASDQNANTGGVIATRVELDGSHQTSELTTTPFSDGYLYLAMVPAAYTPSEGLHYTTLQGNPETGEAISYYGGYNQCVLSLQ